MKISVLHEDAAVLAVDKPAGLLTIPDRHDPLLPNLHKMLEARRSERLWVVHRLDRETSGVVLFARTDESHRQLSQLFQEGALGKFYVGLVNGRVEPEAGSIDAPIAEHPTVRGKMVVNRRGKPSLTDYRVVEQWPLFALVQFQLHTGRTHQLRVHMGYLGHPFVADSVYGNGKPFLLSSIKRGFTLSGKDEEERPLLSRVALHAYRVVVPREDGTMLDIEATLPKDITACVNQLRKWSGGNA
jgi:23S rRNA pseudouridine955/2504/2580 synthase/23S rRNA pseudouridine1911/1915/1917 synthase